MICSIDIGLNGAICMFDNEHAYTLFDMPLTKVNNKKDIDINMLFEILDGYNDIEYIAIEKLNNIFGVSKNTMLSLGKQIGYITAYSVFKKIPLIIVHPKDWQKYAHQDTVELYISGNYKETFYKSISKLINILGKEEVDRNFLLRSRYHDGRVDAYLMAYYVKHKIKKKV